LAAGLRQAELGARVGVRETSVGRYERGKVREAKNLERLAWVLGPGLT
jgi:transcriptional regulator with XRE-family HTH domain